AGGENWLGGKAEGLASAMGSFSGKAASKVPPLAAARLTSVIPVSTNQGAIKGASSVTVSGSGEQKGSGPRLSRGPLPSHYDRGGMGGAATCRTPANGARSA